MRNQKESDNSMQENGEIMVSVVCTAYNYEAYIEKTLDGFVIQKTNFRYQVFVHDDASTDGTRAIIQKYADQYPDLIIPIYQEENQYSKGIHITETFVEPLIHSKYIAYCEGDDYWSDPDKLQIQFDYMEAHPDCSMCVHNSGEINADGKSLGTYFSPFTEDMDVPLERIIMWGKIFQTASYFCKTDLKKKMPDWFFMPVGDYPIAMYMGMNGTVHYMSRVMAQYRVLSHGSWTRMMKSNPTAGIKNSLSWIEALERIDSNTDKVYTEMIFKAKSVMRYGLMAGVVNANYSDLPIKLRLKFVAIVILHFFNLYAFARRIKQRLTRKTI